MIYLFMSIFLNIFSSTISTEIEKITLNKINLDFTDIVKLFPIKKNFKSVGDVLTNRKINSFSFEEAFDLYHIAQKSNSNRYKIMALERMYVTSPDAKIAEIILISLGLEYFNNNKYESAYLSFNQFKQLFPGSKYYILSRQKELEAMFFLCKDADHDTTVTEKFIEALDLYNDDIGIKKENNILLEYGEKAYCILISKELLILDHYITKYNYTFDLDTVYAAVKRINRLKDLLLDIKDLSYKFNRECIFLEMLESIELFNKNNPVPLAEGNKYEEIKEISNEYLRKNYKQINKNIKNFYLNILNSFKRKIKL